MAVISECGEILCHFVLELIRRIVAEVIPPRARPRATWNLFVSAALEALQTTFAVSVKIAVTNALTENGTGRSMAVISECSVVVLHLYALRLFHGIVAVVPVPVSASMASRNGMLAVALKALQIALAVAVVVAVTLTFLEVAKPGCDRV
jgi:hypothetical protein